MSQRASDAFGRLAGTPPRVEPDTPPAPAKPRPVRVYNTRIYRQDQAEAVDQLRDLIAPLLGRRPSVSEVAVAAMITGHVYAEQITAYLASNPNRTGPDR